MSLLSTEEVIKAIPILKSKFGVKIANFLIRLIKMDSINQLYDDLVASGLHNRDGLGFLFDQLSVGHSVNPGGLENIPQEGPFVTISNHPFGGMDGMMLAYIVSEIRDDFKLMANFLLYKIEPLREIFLPVNPFEDRKDLTSSIKGLREAYRHVNAGHPLGLFPAGAVSAINFKDFSIEDRPWPHNVKKLLRQLNVPIIPIHFSGYNSLLFYSLGLINPKLRSLRLPAEVLTKSGKVIKVTIGKAIHPKEYINLSLNDFGDILRTKIYSLDYSFSNKIEYRATNLVYNNEKSFTNDSLVQSEINKIEKELILQLDDFQFYFTQSNKILYSVRSFLKSKEKIYYTNKFKNNIATIDELYNESRYAFVWDRKNSTIVYACRIDLGKEIIENHRMKCIFINNVFKLNTEVKSLVNNSILFDELCFANDYRGNNIFYITLWESIFEIFRNLKYHYLISLFHIPYIYQKETTSLFINFLKENFFDNTFSEHIKSKNRSTLPFPKRLSKKAFLDFTGKNFNKLEEFLTDLEPTFEIDPIICQKLYLMHSTILGLNINTKKSSYIDTLFLTDITMVPENFRQLLE